MDSRDPSSLTRSTDNKFTVTRRRFMAWIGAALSLVGLNRVVYALPERRSAASPDVLSRPRHAAAIPAPYQDYPSPKYVPPGFELKHMFTDNLDGFGEGSAEIAYWFIHPEHPVGYSFPLVVFVATSPVNKSLGTTYGRSGTTCQLISRADAPPLDGIYHDGFWRPAQNGDEQTRNDSVELPEGNGVLIWDTSNVHSIVAQVDSYWVGVKASRLLNVTFEELTRVVISLEQK